MHLAEGGEAVDELLHVLGGGADDHAEEALGEEAGGGEHEAALLVEQLLGEVHVVLNVEELLQLDLNHHVHGGLGPNGRDAADALQVLEGEVGRGLQLLLHVDEVRVRHFLEDARECVLDDGRGVQLDHLVLVDVLQHVVEVPVVVVDDQPAEAPPRQAVDLRNRVGALEGSAGGTYNNGDVAGEVPKGVVFGFLVVDQAVVDLIGNDGHFVFVGKFNNF